MMVDETYKSSKIIWLSFKFIPLILIILFYKILVISNNVDRELYIISIVFIVFSVIFFLISFLLLSYLEINKDGLITKTLFQKHYYCWNDIAKAYQTKFIKPELGIIILKNKPFLKKYIIFIIEEHKMNKFFDIVPFREGKVIKYINSMI